MLDDNFIKEEKGKWRMEELARFGRWLLIIYYDEQVRGQIEFFEKLDMIKCSALLEQMNVNIEESNRKSR